MAAGLTKTITLDSGYDATYWRVCRTDLDFINRTAYIVYCGFKDSTQFDAAPAASLDRRTLSIQGDDFDTYFGTSDDVITQAQAAIVAFTSDLSDAV